jgi:hypothetical protein
VPGPEHVVLTPAAAGAPALNRFRGRVLQAAFLGEATECIVQVNGVNILVRSVAGQFDGYEIVDVFFPTERTLARSLSTMHKCCRSGRS